MRDNETASPPMPLGYRARTAYDHATACAEIGAEFERMAAEAGERDAAACMELAQSYKAAGRRYARTRGM